MGRDTAGDSEKIAPSEADIRAGHAQQLVAGFEHKSRLRRLIEVPLRALGVEVIPTWNLATFAHDFVHAELLRDVFALKRIDCVFDVGAFNGHFGRFLRNKVGFSGTILSFEPQPGPFRVLDESCRHDKHWHAFPVALGADSGEFDMNVMTKLWFSSLRPPSPTTPSNMADRNTVVSQVRVKVERLADVFDDLAERYCFSRPFLKMDTQGFDLAVFAGGQRRIDRFLGLQSEIAGIPIYVGMPDWKEAIAAYENAGFAVSGFFPVSKDDGLRAVELDVIMVRGE